MMKWWVVVVTWMGLVGIGLGHILGLEELRAIERSDMEVLGEMVAETPEMVNGTSYREGRCGPLAYAAQLGHAEVAEFLLEHGAGKEARCFDGEFTPVMLAILCSLQHEVNHNLCPTHLAMASEEERVTDSHFDVLKTLIDHGASLTVSDSHGRSAIHFAALNGHEEMLRLLLGAGAEVDAVDKYGWTPLIYAIQRNDIEAVRILIKSGAKVYGEPGSTSMALHHAVHLGYVEIVETLISFGADPQIPDNLQKTALQYAAENGNQRILKLVQNAIENNNMKLEL